jgi:tetratricopeptide (TPR) repeat protein
LLNCGKSIFNTMQPEDKDPGVKELVERYERCLQEGRPCYFDVDELEDISDFYLNKGKSLESAEVVEMGLQLHPNSSILWLRRATLYLEIGDTKRALQIIDRIPERDDTEAILIRSEIYLHQGRHDDALQLLHRIMDEETSDLSNLALDISGILIQDNQHQEAVEFLLQALPYDEKNMELLFELAYSYEQLNDTHSAIAIYHRILDADPYCSEIWFNLGQASFNEFRYHDAIEAYDFALTINPKDYFALLQKAHALFQSSQYVQAAEAYREYAEGTQFTAATYVYEGESWEKAGQLDQAMICYQKAYEMDPKNVDALTGIGICLMEKEQFRDSLLWFERALRVDQKISETWVYLAEVFVNLEMPDEAVFCYARSLDLEPEQADVLAALGNLQFDAGNYAKSFEFYQQAEALDPLLPGLNLYYALLYGKTGDLERSRQFLAEAIKENPNAQEVYDEFFNETEDLSDETTLN